MAYFRVWDASKVASRAALAQFIERLCKFSPKTV